MTAAYAAPFAGPDADSFFRCDPDYMETILPTDQRVTVDGMSLVRESKAIVECAKAIADLDADAQLRVLEALTKILKEVNDG